MQTPNELLKYIRADLFDDQTAQEYLKELNDRRDEIPFNITQSATEDMFVFDYLGVGDRIGRIARFVGDVNEFDMKDQDFIEDLKEKDGLVIGDMGGRLALLYTDGFGNEMFFFGWIDPDAVELSEDSLTENERASLRSHGDRLRMLN